VAALIILDLVGIAIGPIIAGAGVVGLAIGFGAQTLVKDLITGFFIIFEDQFSVGDYVSINNGVINGTVTSVGLRATTIRTRAQHVVYIQNSAITTSQNYNRERMRVIVDIPLPLNTNLDLLEEVVNEVSVGLIEKMPEIFITDPEGIPVEPPQLENIGSFTDNSLKGNYTVSCLVKDQFYWKANRELRKELTQALFVKGITLS
jgi:small conductance mechanosensitive channel